MVNKTGEAEYRGSQDDKVDKLIQHRDLAISLMFEIKENKKNDVYIEGPLENLKRELNFLLFNYWPKYENDYSEKFELDEDLERKIKEGDPEPNTDNLSYKECRKLLYKIVELMEHLGHTKYETDKTGRRKT